MKQVPIIAAAALLMSVTARSPSLAADEPATVKVALLDMSSAMGMGMMGRGMMHGQICLLYTSPSPRD